MVVAMSREAHLDGRHAEVIPAQPSKPFCVFI